MLIPSVIMLSVAMKPIVLSVGMLIVIKFNVIMMNVVAPGGATVFL
jgi:hypothetical protein